MPDSPTVKLVYDWRDRDGNKARTTIYAPTALPADDIAALASEGHDRLAAVSDATIVKQQIIYSLIGLGSSATAGDALCSSHLLLFYRNAERMEWIHIPAPKASLFETEGNYAGIRVNYADPDVADLINNLTAGLGDVKTPEGDDFPATYLVGGQFI